MESHALESCGNLLDGPGLCEDVHGQFLGRNEYAPIRPATNGGFCVAGCGMIGDRVLGRVLTQTP